MDVETVETTHETETVSEVSADGRTVTETRTESVVAPIDPTPELLERIMKLESRLDDWENDDGGRGSMEPTATETVIEAPPPDKKDDAPAKPASGSAEPAKSAAGEPPHASGGEPPKKKRPGFFF